LIRKALDNAMDDQIAERADEHPDVAAATRFTDCRMNTNWSDNNCDG